MSQLFADNFRLIIRSFHHIKKKKRRNHICKACSHWEWLHVLSRPIFLMIISSVIDYKTRMHSSRMRTIHCSGHRGGRGGVCLGGFCLWGCLPRGCLPRGCLPRGCLPGGCLPGGVCQTLPHGQNDRQV